MWYFVCVILRIDGKLEFYSDFIYTDTYYDATNKCVDIESGDEHFYFKFKKVEESAEDPAEDPKQKFNYSRARMNWKNRLGTTTIKALKANKFESWDSVIHRRFSNYVKLYTDMVMFGTYLIIAHRNLISLYNMGHDNRWIDTVVALGGSSDHVRSL